MIERLVYWATAAGITLGSCIGLRAEVDNYLQPRNDRERRVFELINTCRTQGQAAVAELGSRIGEFPSKYHRFAMEVLSESKSKAAQDILLDIACGRLGLSAERGGAVYFLKASNDKSDARRLFAAKNPEVWCVALRALRGVPVDADLVQDFGRCLQADSLYARTTCSLTISLAPESPFARDMAKALVQSVETIEKSSEAKQPFHWGLDRFRGCEGVGS